MAGQTVCRNHGGSSPQARAAAARRLEERRVESELGKVLAEAGEAAAGKGAEQVLLEQLWRASAMAAVLEVRVGERGESGLLGKNGRGERVEHPLAGMLRHWTVEAARLAKLALDANIAEREVRISEGLAQQLATVIRALTASFLTALADAGLPPEVVRRFEAELPGMARAAIERARVIDVPSERSA